jgi:hypothetical protein
MSEYFRTLDLLFRSNYQVINPRQLRGMMQRHIKRSMLEIETYDGNIEAVNEIIGKWKDKTVSDENIDAEQKKFLMCL